MVEHTGKAFLGLTFNCAHCHDHKYDPIAHEDYFRFRAFFEPIELRQDRVVGEGDPGVFQKYDYSSLRKIVKLGAVRVYDDKTDTKTLMYLGGDERNLVKERAPLQPAGPAFLGGDRLKIRAGRVAVARVLPGPEAIRPQGGGRQARAGCEGRAGRTGKVQERHDAIACRGRGRPS